MSETPAVPEATPTPDAAEPPQTPATPVAAEAEGDARITFQSMADRLTLGLLAAVIGAVLVFISAFLTWSTVHTQVQGKGVVAVSDSLGIAGGRLGKETLVLSLGALAVVAVMLLPATKSWAWRVLLGFGLLSTFFTLYDLVSIPKTLRPGNFCPTGTCSFHRTIGPGVWFTLIASLLIVAGAYVHHIRPVPFRSPGVRPASRRRSQAA